jgi:hypothetical protein
MPGSSKWSLSPRFPYQNPIYINPLPHTCYMPHPPHSSWFNHPKNTGEYRSQSSLCSFLHSPVSLSLLGPNILSSILFSTLPIFLPQSEQSSFTPIKNNKQNYSSVHLNIYTFGYQSGRQKILHLDIILFTLAYQETFPIVTSCLNCCICVCVCV